MQLAGVSERTVQTPQSTSSRAARKEWVQGPMADGALGADGRESKNWNTTLWESGDLSGSRLKIPKSPETLGPWAGLQGGEDRMRWGRSGKAVRTRTGAWSD